MAARDRWRPPRDCNDYWAEWKHCKSLRNRFHNYYTYGTPPMCEEWKTGYIACNEWQNTRSSEAKETLQQFEKSMMQEKHKHSPVWTLRKKPPPDWHLPLNTGKPTQ
ncbi:synaptic plasticity regulator PANTS [Pelodytes ibericus]